MSATRLRLALACVAAALVLALPAPAPAAPGEGFAQAARAGRVFAGSGSARLGTLRLRRAAVLRWSASGGLQLYDRRGFMVLNSRAGHGRMMLRRGVYRGLRVVSAGRWRIAVRRR